MPLIHYCAKCGKGCDSLMYGLCDSCRDGMEGKFKKARDLDWDAQKDAMKEYGARSIEEALVIKNIGKPKIDFVCSGCGSIISREQAESAQERGTAMEGDLYYCRSCKSDRDKRLEKLRSRDRNRFNNL
mgnify:CR=1 FL=1